MRRIMDRWNKVITSPSLLVLILFVQDLANQSEYHREGKPFPEISTTIKTTLTNNTRYDHYNVLIYIYYQLYYYITYSINTQLIVTINTRSETMYAFVAICPFAATSGATVTVTNGAIGYPV